MIDDASDGGGKLVDRVVALKADESPGDVEDVRIDPLGIGRRHGDGVGIDEAAIVGSVAGHRGDVGRGNDDPVERRAEANIAGGGIEPFGKGVRLEWPPLKRPSQRRELGATGRRVVPHQFPGKTSGDHPVRNVEAPAEGEREGVNGAA